MSLANVEVPLRVITPDDVRASIKRAKRSLERAAEEIVWQIEMEAWRTLGYGSWSAMREAEYGGAAFMVPAKNRPELLARIRASGLTQQEIADTAGVSRRSVERDLNATNAHSESSATITNSRGQERPATYTRSRDNDVVDAEIVSDSDDDAETGPVAASPAPITVTCPTCLGTGEVTR